MYLFSSGCFHYHFCSVFCLWYAYICIFLGFVMLWFYWVSDIYGEDDFLEFWKVLIQCFIKYFFFFIFSPSSPPEIIFASLLAIYYWSAERDFFSSFYFSLDIFYCPDFQWANLFLCAHCEAVNSSFLVTFFISIFSIVLLQGFTFLH